MTPPRHISLDFWGTLAQPNPSYAIARNGYLAKLFGVPVKEVETKYSQLKRWLDKGAAEVGASIPPDLCWDLLVRNLSPGFSPEDDAFDVMCHAEKLFLKNAPIISSETRDQIARLSKQGVTFSIGSNTNFICGERLWGYVKWLRLPFSFGVFSDEIMVSKPHPAFFDKIKEQVKGRELVHIGDSYECDITGSHLANIQGVLIKDALDLSRVLSQF